MDDITPKTKGDRVGWESSSPIWAGYSGNPSCHLCKENPGEVYRKGHTRRHGVHLEASVMYCKACSTDHQEEVDQDFEKWWAEQWAESEARAEKNWQEHGIYTNVGYSGHPSGLSTYFGYVKLEDGSFRPYRYEHPKDDKDVFDRDLDDETRRIDALEISEEEKFGKLLEFLKSDKIKNLSINPIVAEREIKKIEEHLNG
jgi:hypothetical protein